MKDSKERLRLAEEVCLKLIAATGSIDLLVANSQLSEALKAWRQYTHNEPLARVDAMYLTSRQIKIMRENGILE